MNKTAASKRGCRFLSQVVMSKRIKKETIFQIGGLILTVAAFGAAVFAVSKMIAGRDTGGTEPTYSYQSNQAPVFYYDGKEYHLRENMEVILVMGVDDYEVMDDNGRYVNQSQADVLYVYAVDHANRTYQAIQLNRDTMTAVRTLDSIGRDDGLEVMQICLAHAYGIDDEMRCRNTKEAVEGLLFDVPVDHFLSLTMAAIPILNEQVGGVTVTVPAGLESADPDFVAGATITLHGDQAEKFVRARESLANDTNEFRMERQQIFLNAWKSQAEEKLSGNPSFGLNLTLALTDVLVSDMSANQLSDFANMLSEYTDLGTLKTEGMTLDAGGGRAFREYHIDTDDLQLKVIELFYEEAGESGASQG